MKNKVKYFFTLICSVALLTGCFPEKAEEALKYNGPAVVEFKNHTLGVLTAALTPKGVTGTQTDSSRTVLLNTRQIDTVFVQLVGPQRGSDVNVGFELKSNSTAVEGVHYRFIPEGARTVVIPANQSVGRVLIQMIPNSIETVGQIRTVGLNLTGTDDLRPSANYDVFWLNIRR